MPERRETLRALHGPASGSFLVVLPKIGILFLSDRNLQPTDATALPKNTKTMHEQQLTIHARRSSDSRVWSSLLYYPCLCLHYLLSFPIHRIPTVPF